MKIQISAVALTIALSTAAFAQPAASEAEHSTMDCCERDADGNMTGCEHMQGGSESEHGTHHGSDAHQGMNHENMDHGSMAQDGMNHQCMDHGGDSDADSHADHEAGEE